MGIPVQGRSVVQPVLSESGQVLRVHPQGVGRLSQLSEGGGGAGVVAAELGRRGRHHAPLVRQVLDVVVVGAGRLVAVAVACESCTISPAFPHGVRRAHLPLVGPKMVTMLVGVGGMFVW